jgi:hypothetical protein
MIGKSKSLSFWIILFSALALGGVLWRVLIYEPILEGQCKLVPRKVKQDSQLTGLAIQILEPLPAKPSHVLDLPPAFDRPCFYQIRSAERSITMVLNMGKRPKLCVDSDGDGDLSQEQCFDAKTIRETRSTSRYQQFGPIPPVSQDESSAGAGQFYVHHYREDAPGPLFTYPIYSNQGKLRLGNCVYKVAVVDGDVDGRFNSVLRLPQDHGLRIPSSDTFGIDLNGNGKFEISTHGHSEVMPLGRLVKVADSYYALDVSAAEQSLTLTKTEPQLGTLLIEPNDTVVRLKLWSDAADQCLSGRQWQLPAGKYKAVYLELEKRCSQGGIWTFSSRTTSARTRLGKLDFFTIDPEETTSIKLGPPFLIKTDIEKTSSGTVDISPVILGCAGEEYALGRHHTINRTPHPTFKIIDEKGTVLLDDSFQYG